MVLNERLDHPFPWEEKKFNADPHLSRFICVLESSYGQAKNAKQGDGALRQESVLSGAAIVEFLFKEDV